MATYNGRNFAKGVWLIGLAVMRVQNAPEQRVEGYAVRQTPGGIKMFKLLLRVAMGLMLSLLGRSAWAVEQATIDQVVNVAKIGCLLGNEFTFDAKANGDITFAKLRPGAEAGLHTNIKEDPGAPGIIDQQLKLVASQQIRDCMKPYIEKLAELILGQASGNPITSANAAIALDLGDCPLQGAAIFTNEATKTQTFSCDCPAQPEIGGYMVGTSV
jgi:hypothetical protein